MTTAAPVSQRLASIDAFRALTMVLMIFVNDLWSLSGIPLWLEHTEADVDGMGLADWVFPGFLFIVGLSIPFAIRARYRKGDSKLQVFKHILMRSVALWVMGLFMVNLEMTDASSLPIPPAVWQILMILGFILIWNAYPETSWMRVPVLIWRILGIGILIGLAAIYRAGSSGDLHWMQLHWWGILGLIGWGYFLCSTLYLLIGNSLVGLGISTLALFGMNALEFLPVSFQPQFVIGTATHASVILGVMLSVFLSRYVTSEETANRYWPWLLLASTAVLFIYGFGTRPIWGISKIYGTPSWVAICGAVSILVFLGLYVICDRKKWTRWTAIIAPAGRSTLTCYLMPYWIYAVMILAEFQLPALLTTGILGLSKSLILALLVVQLTRLMERIDIRVRI